MSARATAPRGSLALAALLAVIGALAFLIVRSESLPEGPRPVVWDRTVCAECRMAVSEPPYAAQLQMTDGRVLDFDDVGCLFRHLARQEGTVHAIYLRHLRQERWLAADEAGFVPAGPSPMGYGLGAVALAEEGGLTFAQARDRILDGTRGCAHGQD